MQERHRLRSRPGGRLHLVRGDSGLRIDGRYRFCLEAAARLPDGRLAGVLPLVV
jgi:hypothetical protein